MDTLSVSDLSINEQQLLAFNEYMIKTDNAKHNDLHATIRESWKAFPLNQSKISRISVDRGQSAHKRTGTGPGNE